MRVIFDSSFLMAVVERPTTWAEDIAADVGRFQPVLLGCVRDELRAIASGRGRKARTARVALELAAGFAGGSCGGASVDDEIMSQALSDGALVATIDSGLLRSLRAAHVKAVTLRRGRVALG
ncbi:MAG: hypothetical protein JRN57_00790 [Nitrososphaerota archaeon]|nr:hypothetical protein [Nitrososphaerota archaeon]